MKSADLHQLAVLEGITAGCADCGEHLAVRRRVERELSEQRDRLRAMSSELALAEEGERRRIAGGLHDHVGQVLGVAKVKLGQALAADPAADGAGSVSEARRLVEEAIREIRSLTFELSSPVLHDLGLEPALLGLTERAHERHGLAFGFVSDGLPGSVAEEAAVLLYSIVRELMWNVIQHAGAASGALALARDGELLRITVSDDGAGFDAAGAGESLTEGGGLGLFSARQRLEHLGGGLEIDSALGAGTRVTLTLPLVAGSRRREGRR